MDKQHLEELTGFIREHRSNESNFNLLYAKLEAETAERNGQAGYTNSLIEVKEKTADEYHKAKETHGSAWPEFEKFVSDFEKTVTEALREAS